MPTVIDELTIALGLDAKKFRPAVEEATRSTRKFRDEAEKHAKELGKAFGGDLSDAFTKVTRAAVGFLAALAGARAIEQFTANVTSGGVALGQLAATMGSTPERLSAIGLAVERVGGSSEGAWNSLKRLNDARIAFQTRGEPPNEWFQWLGIDLSKAKSAEDVMKQAMRSLDASKYSMDQKYYILEQLGVTDRPTATMYLEGDAEKKIQAASIDAVTTSQVKAARELYDAWEQASQATQNFGRMVEERVEPRLKGVLDWYTSIISRLTDWADQVHSLRDVKVLGVDLQSFMDELSSFGAYLSLAAGAWAGVIEAKVMGVIHKAMDATRKLAEVVGHALVSPAEAAGLEAGIAPPAEGSGVSVLVGGAPVSESTPLPVKIIGTVQTGTPPPVPDAASAGASPTDTPSGASAPAPASGAPAHWWTPFTNWLTGSGSGSAGGSPPPAGHAGEPTVLVPKPGSGSVFTEDPRKAGRGGRSVTPTVPVQSSSRPVRSGWGWIIDPKSGGDQAAEAYKRAHPDWMKHYNAGEPPATGPQSFLGGAHVGASAYASTLPREVHRSSTSVSIAAVNFSALHHAASRVHDASRQLSDDLFALRSDVGLA